MRTATIPRRLVFWDVDTQRDFMEPDGALYVPGAAALISNLERLTATVRRLGGILVATVCDHTETDAELSVAPDFRRTFPPHCLRGTPGHEKIEATRLRSPVAIDNRPYAEDTLARLLPGPGGEILIKKQAFDVFTNPATTLLIALLNPHPVVVYGVALDLCVDRAIVGLADAGCHVLFVEDASCAIDADRGRLCVARWRRLGVGFTTTDEVVGGAAFA
jgi:nicotinamidase/pyrazinamidase